jgi:hypothetical protein
MSNLVFCSPATKVIEIFSPLYVNVCYWALSEEVGLDYFCVLGQGRVPDHGIDPHFVPASIAVDIDDLRRTLDLALR